MRKVATRGARRATYKHFSLTSGRIVQAESSAELELSFVLDALPVVTSYAEQPFGIEYWNLGRVNLHIPDFAAIVSGRRYVFEVKKEDWKDPDVLARTALMKNLLAPHGIVYEMVSPGSLPNVIVRNSVALLHRARVSNTFLGISQLSERVEKTPQITLGELGWNESPIHGMSVAREIIEGRLLVDMTRPLSEMTRLSMHSIDSIAWRH